MEDETGPGGGRGASRAPHREGALSIDEEGRFLVHGDPITHERTLEVLWRSLERVPDGTWQVRVGREVAAVAVAETPFAVRGVLEAGGTLVLRVSGGAEEPLDPSTLRVGPDGVLRCALRDGRPARFTRAAQLAVGALLEEDASVPSGFRIALGGSCWPVGGSGG